MAVPQNNLVQVQTYQESGLIALQNQNCFMDPRVCNSKFKDFQNLTGNKGDTVTFAKPYRAVAMPTLTVTFQGTEMRQQSLTVDQAWNVARAFTAEQFIFDVDEYMDQIGLSAVQALGAKIEANAAQGIIDHTYRFYGDGTTSINSYGQLALALAFDRDYGAVNTGRAVGIIDNISSAQIVDSGSNKFAPARNDQIVMSWEVGSFSNCDWFNSNLLKVHIAGFAGINQTQLTFSSISADGTQITFTHGAGIQADFFKSGDLLYFQNTDLRYVTWTGYETSQNAVQVRITADSDSGSGTVVANIYPALSAVVGDQNQNLNRPLVGSDVAKVVTSHRAGIIMTGKPFYLAMPKLPSTSPFDSAQTIDPDTGISLRMYHGEIFGQNQRGMVHDVLWGLTYADEYCMRLCLPISG